MFFCGYRAGPEPETSGGEEALDPLLAREDIDAVTIVVPIFVQAKYAIKALRAGKHGKIDVLHFLSACRVGKCSDCANLSVIDSASCFVLTFSWRFFLFR